MCKLYHTDECGDLLYVYLLWDWLEVWHTPDVYLLFELLQGIQLI